VAVERGPEGPRRLVLCCDGTWERPDQTDRGLPAPTNVAKLALAIAPRDATGREQVVLYQRGVGTDRRERWTGGAFGVGLGRHVQDCYRWLVETYRPGDEIWLLGFSRGAFTARSTAGFVRNCGILCPEHAGRLDDAWDLYRDRSPRTHPAELEATLFRRSYALEEVTPIRFLGVWDTVGALGIPVGSGPLVNLVNRRYRFHDTQLSRTVRDAAQALAVDERRAPFRPTLWTWPPGGGPDPALQRVTQVWFPGVHNGVGGGYAQPELSDVALAWMLERAEGCGLAVDRTVLDDPPSIGAPPRPAFPAFAPDPCGPFRESRTGLYRLLPGRRRRLGPEDPTQSVSAAALERRERVPGYRPPNLDAYLRASGDPP
jgi:uncharacterized protein (DUF2235 family)